MNFKLTAVFAAIVLLAAPFARAQPVDDPASIWTLQDENASVSRLKLSSTFRIFVRLAVTS
jgi:hypothetical protein